MDANAHWVHGGVNAPRMLCSTEIQSSLNQSCQNYSTWTKCLSEKHNSSSISIFHCQKVESLQKTWEKVLFCSQMLEAVTLLSYDMLIKTKRATEVLHSSEKQCLTVLLQAALCRSSRKPLALKCCWMLFWPLENGPEINSWSRTAF